MALTLLGAGIDAADILIVDREREGIRPANQLNDARILALNGGSRRFLGALGVWDELAPGAHPMRSIAISDTGLEELVRPFILNFAQPEQDEPLAHLVSLAAIQNALRDACNKRGVTVLAAGISSFEYSGGHIFVIIDNGERIRADLLIGADGARSFIRSKAGIPVHGHAYGQVAISATIRHSGPHDGEAVQHFLPEGPFAMLPLDEGRSSIVWSEKATVARDILASSRPEQLRAIAARAAGVRGDIIAIEAISSHPLQLGLARRFIASRIALIADAAHVVHPLAGQGLNLGFEDAAMLGEIIVERARLGLDCGAPDMLEAYQARRRPAAVAMGFATDAINRLFSNASSPLRVLRDLGLGLVERAPGLKSRFQHVAAGVGSRAPRLFRGEAI